MSWSKEQCQVLLQEYQKYPCLYAIKTPLYRNKHARLDALQKIQAVVKEVKPSVSVQDIKLKFNGLKTNFMTEYKKWKSSRHSGAGNDDGEDSSYKPTIWYFKLMFFLLEHCEVRTATDSLTQEETECESQEAESTEYTVGEEGVLQETSDMETPPLGSPAASCSSSNGMWQSKPKKRKIQNDLVEANLIREASNTLATINRSMSQNNYSNDEDEAFAKYVSTKLRKITSEAVRMEVEQQIIGLLCSGIRECN
ncbi:hypothetical protein PPYR_04888 [Photinus pyralis]|uniref:MADF domain-containing protein n=1 Tax=Photinus pyralis TaxID=7054 RepID=A0A5N4AZC1_PHOPY|nr:uncharacterized protein LOC116164020 [Photinus pyralis]KAB0802702.1 hypothetical protein PPYR_04888 [Photinus pyralis]